MLVAWIMHGLVAKQQSYKYPTHSKTESSQLAFPVFKILFVCFPEITHKLVICNDQFIVVLFENFVSYFGYGCAFQNLYCEGAERLDGISVWGFIE